MNRLKIAVASSGLGHVTRGIETWAHDLAYALHARGHDVILYKGGGSPLVSFERVVPCWQRESKRTRTLLRWSPRRVRWRFGLGSPYAVEQTTFALRLLPILRRDRPHILHLQDPQIALVTHRAWRLGIVPTRILLAHGTEEPLDFLKRFDFLQHLAPFYHEEARRAGVDHPAWTAIPNFIDTEHFQPGTAPHMRRELGIPDEAVVVICVAAIKRHHKRIDFLLHEFAQTRAQRPDLPLWLIVAGGWETETNDLIALGQTLLGDRVRFLVRFPRERIPNLLQAADLFALTSLKEMMPIALLEAISTGLPCLVHHDPVLRWIIGTGGEALDLTRSGTLAQAIIRLADQPERRRELGRQARTHCLETFSTQAVVERIVNHYHRVMTFDPNASALKATIDP